MVSGNSIITVLLLLIWGAVTALQEEGLVWIAYCIHSSCELPVILSGRWQHSSQQAPEGWACLLSELPTLNAVSGSVQWGDSDSALAS